MNVLDVAQNSVAAGAKLVQITLEADEARDTLLLAIEDDGHGMTSAAAQRAADPFYTTRTTRKVGLGLPFLKMAAGDDRRRLFHYIAARPRHACVCAVWPASYRPRPFGGYGFHHCGPHPVQPGHRFRLHCARGGGEFCADTREMRAVLGGVPLSEPSVAQWIREFIEENTQPILEGVI